jgi:predicted nucleic acid-binding protein
LLVPDSSILIAYLRFGKYRQCILGRLKGGTLLVPGVVLCELYAGATSREDRNDLEVFRRALGSRVLGIADEDWVLVGRCLSYYSVRWGRIRPRDHLVDATVAVVAVQAGAALTSEDVHQVQRWRWVLARLGKRLTIAQLSAKA